MKNTTSREFDSARRRVLRAAIAMGAVALAPSIRAFAATAEAPRVQVRFLTREEGAAALAHTPGDTYYAGMRLLESRSRTNSPMTGVSLADARIAVRDYEAAAVREFTPAECAGLRAAVERLQPVLAARAPLYARTPWSFIKLANEAEGGMPHTRGAHIVVPAAMAAAFARTAREIASSDASGHVGVLLNLLVHEQTHVLERANPALFEPLITEVFGFTRMSPVPTTPWLETHEFVNPDGPDVAWAFALDKIGGQGWVMPHLVVPDMALPRMPDDFQGIGVEVVRTADGWRVLEDGGSPRRRDLGQIAGYHAHFPFADEDFHPNEIAAVTLAHWILQDVPDLAARPLMPAVDAWARKALA